MLGLENHESKRFSEKKLLQDLTDIASRLQHLGPVGEAQRVGSITALSEAQEQRRKIISKLRST